MVDVLVVDDCRDFAELLELCLIRQGLSAHLCFDGVEAIEYLRTNSVDLIITDLVMPRMSGDDFRRERLRQNIAITTPVLLMSGMSDKPPGFDGYLSKPIDVE